MPKRIYHPKDPELYQRKPGGNFHIWHEGRDKSLGTSDFSKAKKAKEYHRALVSTYGAASFNATFGGIFPEYTKHLWSEVADGGKRKSYIESIEWYWSKYLESFWSKRRLMEFNQVTWDQFCKTIKRKFAVSDFTNHRSTMTGFLTWCRGRNLILMWPEVKNPAHKSRKRKIIPPEHLRLIFEHAPTVQQWREEMAARKPSRNRRKRSELKRFIVPGGLRLFLACYLFQGMRREEITKLTISRVNLKRMYIVLRDDDVKTKDAREIPLNRYVAALLLERFNLLDELRIKTKYVFPNARDTTRPMTSSGFKTVWAKVLEKAEIKDLGYTWHDFRATFEKAMSMSKDFTDVQKEKMVGASLKVQSKIYISMDADDLRGLENVIQVPGLTEKTPDESEGQDDITVK